VLQVGALVAVSTILLSLLTSFATYQVLLAELDHRVDSTYSRLGRDPGAGNRPPGGGIGQPAGAVAVVFRSNGAVVAEGRVTEAGWESLGDNVIEALRASTVASGKTSVDLPGLGAYRLSSARIPGGTVVVGLPMTALNSTMLSLVALQGVLILATVAIAVAIARAFVISSLRPLNRLATTATTVSQLNLERGEVSLGERVTEDDTDPRSEVGRVGTAFNLMLDNVENALAVRQESESKVRQFVADASHELRNPLASIRGYAELTRRERDGVPEEVRYALDRIESESDRMSALVNDLLLLARLDSGPAIAACEVDVSEIVLNAVADTRATDSTHDWAVTVPDEPVVCTADPHRLHQVVANLLSNARTHTPAGTHVRTVVTGLSDEVRIEVTDDGPGIPADLAPHVFERFMRAEESRVRSGGPSTGLGLAIVKAVAEAHGGAVAVDSRPGRTSFLLTLPRTTPADAAAKL
jgi:two-component system OmpR family sensor kinase